MAKKTKKTKTKNTEKATEELRTIATRAELRELRGVVQATLSNMLKYYDDWDDDILQRWDEISRFYVCLCFFPRNKIELEVLDVTDRYAEVQPDIYGWEKNLVVLEWKTVNGAPRMVVIPTVDWLIKAHRQKKPVFSLGAVKRKKKRGKKKKKGVR